MKKLLALLILFGLSTISFAQRGMQFSIDEHVQNLTNELELTQSQADSVRMILEEQRTQMQDLKERAQGNRPQMRSQMMEIIYTTDRKIELLLNDKQKEAYKTYTKEKRSGRQMMR
jgi:VIT1/CCC1 family predicted Fe2+/Mn2+ transporter